MRINERLLGYRVRYPFLFLDYLFWLIFDFSKFKVIKKEKIKKVLIFHTGAIGELVMISPIVRQLREQLNCKVDILVKESMAELFKDNPNVNKIIFYSDDFKDLAGKLKKEKYDLSVIFQASFKNALICHKAGIKYRIGGFSRIKRFPVFLYTRRTFPTIITHSLDYSFGIVKKIGIEKPSNLKTEVYISKSNEKSANGLMSKPYAKGYAVIHPGFGPVGKKSPPRVWQNEKYAAIADYLYEERELKVIFTGLKDQRHLIDKIILNCKNKGQMINFAGNTKIQEFCALIKNSKFVLAPDTGASHIAASFGIPLVNLMDAPIEEWAPIGPKDKIVNIHHPREIALFEKSRLFREIGGVASISAEEVKKAINFLL